jgi:hypothetical protein
MKLVPVPKNQYGTLYDGDSYIVYAASEYGKPIAADYKVCCNHRAINKFYLTTSMTAEQLYSQLNCMIMCGCYMTNKYNSSLINVYSKVT